MNPYCSNRSDVTPVAYHRYLQKDEMSLKRQIIAFVGLFSCFIGIAVTGITIIILGAPLTLQNSRFSALTKCHVLQDRYDCGWKTGKMVCSATIDYLTPLGKIVSIISYELCKDRATNCLEIKTGQSLSCWFDPGNPRDVNLSKPSMSAYSWFYFLMFVGGACLIFSILLLIFMCANH